MELRPAVRAGMPTDREPLLDQNATARTRLARERRVDRDHLSTGACCLVPCRQGWSETPPSPHQQCSWPGGGSAPGCGPASLVIHHSVGADQLERRIMM